MIENSKEKALEICKVLYDKKAFDIEAIPVGEKTVIADWFVICSGTVVNQVRALCDEMEEKAKDIGLNLIRKEGYDAGRWIVLDFGDILVHIFHQEERQYYNIERLWDTEGNSIKYPDKE